MSEYSKSKCPFIAKKTLISVNQDFAVYRPLFILTPASLV